MKCPKCDYENDPEALNCGMCSELLPEAAGASEPPPEGAPPPDAPPPQPAAEAKRASAKERPTFRVTVRPREEDSHAGFKLLLGGLVVALAVVLFTVYKPKDLLASLTQTPQADGVVYVWNSTAAPLDLSFVPKARPEETIAFRLEPEFGRTFAIRVPGGYGLQVAGDEEMGQEFVFPTASAGPVRILCDLGAAGEFLLVPVVFPPAGLSEEEALAYTERLAGENPAVVFAEEQPRYELKKDQRVDFGLGEEAREMKGKKEVLFFKLTTPQEAERMGIILYDEEEAPGDGDEGPGEGD